jgi:nitric oxide reductase subunit B
MSASVSVLSLTRRLWIVLITMMVVSFAVLGYYGWQIYQQAPPIPKQVVTTDGRVLFTGADIQDGQNVWQSMGGQEVGSIWGHGAYVAPDWSADWLHREATWLLERWSQAEGGTAFELAAPERRAALQARLRGLLRPNTYDPASGTLRVDPLRAEAIAAVAAHYDGLFGSAAAWDSLRDAYALPANALPDAERRRQLTAFFFWTAWACVTERPGSTVTFTNNWPAEELVGNRPTAPLVVWSALSLLGLLGGIGALVWYFAAQRRRAEAAPTPPMNDPLAALTLSPSMRATFKYFVVVAALLVAQVLLGVITAHYGVEGGGFFGIPLAQWLPYSVTRTWHNQLGIFWIATAWLATGLFVAPAVAGHEPRGQKLGVDLLFGALLVIVVGSLAGQWLGIHQRLGLETNFWFGHQGYEYVDLGRFWQLFLFVGLFIWLFLMGRALVPALRRAGDGRSLLGVFLMACVAIALFYGAGLMWGRHTHLALAEYWRWWVVHLWVEGFFEVFATAVIAFLFTRLGLLSAATAGASVLLSTIIYLTGGILGTFHHLYFTGTPTPVLALGAMFSALEIVPLVLVGFEAYDNLDLLRVRAWMGTYRWPVMFFVAVAFWNLVGAGLFGFLINPPLALYYMQGLNTTPVHGHTALFGVYGMLGIGLMLFCLKALGLAEQSRSATLRLAFWCLNGGLAAMVLLSLLPVGLLQTWASVEHGLWYARSAEFLQTPLMARLRWLRVIGDLVFSVGVLALAWFVFRARRAPRPAPTAEAGRLSADALATLGGGHHPGLLDGDSQSGRT